ncbi:probable G-protein coupled receptor Mth-like 14 [Sergentomyia squamirostris]
MTNLLWIILLFNQILSSVSEENTTIADNSSSSSSLSLPTTILQNEGESVQNTTIVVITTNPTTTAAKFSSSSVDSTLDQIPPTCQNLKKLSSQPIFTEHSAIKKCCPPGENLIHNNPSRSGKQCHPSAQPFQPTIVNATFYDGCIEDEESDTLSLPETYGNPCSNRQSFIFSKHDGDLLYVLLNGSLLIINEQFEWKDVRDEYCLDTDDNGTLSAVVCPQAFGSSTPEAAVTQAQLVFLAICMLLSIPCLLVTSFFYLVVEDLRTLHGKSLACHCLCLALRFTLITAIQLQIAASSDEGVSFSNYFIYMIQYFILAAFFWQFVMSVDIVINVWYYLPKNISPKGTMRGWIHFSIYSTLSMILPIVFICAAISRHEQETPYFLKGVHWDAHSNQNFYILPVVVLLSLCFTCFIGAYYGFQQLNELNIMAWLMRMNPMKKHDNDIYPPKLCTKEMEYVKQSAKSTFYMYCIQAVCFIIEIISFYANGNNIILMFDTINALQGMLILTIFICLPHTLKIIKMWWKDRGSHVVTPAGETNRNYNGPPGSPESIPLRNISKNNNEKNECSDQ